MAKKNLGVNPILPLWEHVPDGEPYVFEDPDQPGRYRIYLYGSHDIFGDAFCGDNLVVWSAPVEDPGNWRRDGMIFSYQSGEKADVLYAPDVAEVVENGKKTYYLYPNNQAAGRTSMVCKANRPDGPFEVCNWKVDENGHCSTTETEGILGFDPAVFVDDDGRVYGYWGFTRSHGAELDPLTMATVKPGTEIVQDMIPGIPAQDNEIEENDFRFFEASSMRKIKDKYVFIYSRTTKPGEFGLDVRNYTLAYAYSDHPLGPFTYGGTIIDGRARETGENGEIIASGQPWGNTHGSIAKIEDQWYVFYHRMTNEDLFCRQAMVAPITVRCEEGPGGKVTISEGEVTSEGFSLEGLNPYESYPAAIACWHTGGPYIKATYDESKNINPVEGIRDGAILGYKYFCFSGEEGNPTALNLNLISYGVDTTVEIMLDRPWASQGGKQIGASVLADAKAGDEAMYTVKLEGLEQIEGKHAVFFVFKSQTEGEIGQLNTFEFISDDLVEKGERA